jgi:hypothetical protein
MTQAFAILTALLFQEATPFESAGTIVFSSAVGDVRPATADKDRALETETRRLKKWLRIPATLDKDLQVGVYCWLWGTEKNGVVEVTDAIVLPGNSILGPLNAAPLEKVAFRFPGMEGGCNHMPAIPRSGCKPQFSGTITVDNQRSESINVVVERVFWSDKRDELGTSTDKIEAGVKTESGPAPLPAKIEPGTRTSIVLNWPMKPEDCRKVKTTITVVLKLTGERFILRNFGKYTFSW